MFLLVSTSWHLVLFCHAQATSTALVRAHPRSPVLLSATLAPTQPLYAAQSLMLSASSAPQGPIGLYLLAVSLVHPTRIAQQQDAPNVLPTLGHMPKRATVALILAIIMWGVVTATSHAHQAAASLDNMVIAAHLVSAYAVVQEHIS